MARIAMEQIIGRPLLPKEVVHHIDGNTNNNNPDNLILFSTHSEHLKYHYRLRQEDRKFASSGFSVRKPENRTPNPKSTPYVMIKVGGGSVKSLFLLIF